MKAGGRGLLGCAVASVLALGALAVVALPPFLSESNARKAGEASRLLRQIAASHAANPAVAELRFEPGSGGDAGWKALALPEDAVWHSFEGWTTSEGLWIVATGNLDSDPALDEWEWSPLAPRPVQLRADGHGNEWQELYWLEYDHGQAAGDVPNPLWSRAERMEIARRRMVFGSSLSGRFAVEEIGDRETARKMKTGAWLAFEEESAPAALAELGYGLRIPHRIAARESAGGLVVVGTANLDSDPCPDRWVLRPPARFAVHESDDVDDRGCRP